VNEKGRGTRTAAGAEAGNSRKRNTSAKEKRIQEAGAGGTHRNLPRGGRKKRDPRKEI